MHHLQGIEGLYILYDHDTGKGTPANTEKGEPRNNEMDLTEKRMLAIKSRLLRLEKMLSDDGHKS